MKNVVILPTYNEKENVELIVPQIFKVVPDIFVTVMDDNSPDGTAEIVRSLMKKYPNLSLIQKAKKEGLGKAYVHAFRKVMADKNVRSVIMMDADLSHDPAILPEMIELSKKHNVVVGSRYIKGGGTVGWELWRRVLSRLGNLYCKAITRLPINDFTGGYNLIHADLLRKIDFDTMDSSGYAFIIELKYLLARAGARFREVPFVFKNRIGGESKISNHIIREGVLAPWKLLSRRVIMRKCPACGETQHNFYSTKKGYDLYRCSHCRMFGLEPIPKAVEDIVYTKEYFTSGERGFGYANYDHDKEPMRPIFEKYMRKVEKRGIKKGTLLDVGAATGFFMAIAEGLGWKTKGVEISQFAAESAREKGLDVIHGTIDDIKVKPESLDVITMWDVLEHLMDPRMDIEKVYSMLRPGGLLLINTPDSSSFFARLLGKRWHLIIPPEHIHYFSKKSIDTMLRRKGFQVLEISRIGKKFTLGYVALTLQKWLGLRFPESVIKKFGKITMPINLHDNMFVIAQKI